MLEALVGTIVMGFFVGALARWAIPGPDPMPAWLTIFFGLSGGLFGGTVAFAVVGADMRGDIFAILLTSIAVASAFVIAYRRFVQKRPIMGPEAHLLPSRGFGIAKLRQRLRRFGIDPDSIGQGNRPSPLAGFRSQPTVNDQRRDEQLRKLRELRDDGVLTDEEYERKKAEVEARF